MNLTTKFILATNACARVLSCCGAVRALPMAVVFGVLFGSLQAHTSGVSVRVTGWAQAVAAGGGGRPLGEPATFAMSGSFSPFTPGGDENFSSENYYAGNGSVGITLPSGVVRMEVGRLYGLVLAGEWVNQVRVSLTAPPGYRMEIDGLVRERFTDTPSGATYGKLLAVRVVAISSPALRFGEPTKLATTGIYWSVGLGSLISGESAGSLGLADNARELDMAHLFTPAALTIDSSSPEVMRYYSGSPVVLSQIKTPEGVVAITPLSATSFQISFYRAWQVQGSGFPFTFSGDPQSEFILSKGASSDTRLEITHLARDLSKVPVSSSTAYTESTAIVRSGYWPEYTWLRTDWHTGPAAITEAETVATLNQGQGVRTEVLKIRDVGSTTPAVFSSRAYFLLAGWGEIETGSTAGTTNPAATTLDYYNNSSQTSHGLLKSRIDNGGRWEAYEYYLPSDEQPARPKYVFRPFNTAPSSITLTPSQGEVTYYEYSSDIFGVYTRPALSVTKVNDTLVARSATTYSNIANVNGMNVVQATRTDRSNNNPAHVLTTTTHYYREDTTDAFFRDKVHAVARVDGVKTAYAYQRGSLSGETFTPSSNGGTAAGTASRFIVIHGTTQSAGNALRQTENGYDIDDLYLVTSKSTKEVVLRNEQAQVVLEATFVWEGSDWSAVPVAQMTYIYDDNGRLTEEVALNGARKTYAWTGLRLESETDATGVKLSYEYDAAGRVAWLEKEAGGPLAAPLRTTYTYNAAGEILTETLSAGASTSETIVTSRTFDDAGRLHTAAVPSPGMVEPTSAITQRSYNPSTRTVTTTTPDGGTKIETLQIDGRLASLTGTGVVPQYYTYSVEPDGRRLTRVNHGTDGSPRWQKSWVDWLGRPVGAERPGFSPTNQTNFIEESFYDDSTIGSGRLYKVSRTGLAPTRFEYDALGAVIRSGLDLNNDGLVKASSDRINEANSAFEKVNGVWWHTSTTRIYPTINSDASLLTSVSRTRLTGLANGAMESSFTDADGNVATTTIAIERTSKKVTTTVVRSGFGGCEVSVAQNGLAVSSKGHDGLETKLEYDALGRTLHGIDTRGKITTASFHKGTELPRQIKDTADNLLQTLYYDSHSRVVAAVNAGGFATRYAYNLRGQLTHQWGAAEYPVEYGYDAAYGDRTSMKTFRGGTNWDATAWPSTNTGDADTTTWTFDAASGLLWKKTDAANKPVTYNYNQRGQVSARTWARGVVTNYAYFGDQPGEAATGELRQVSYASDPAGTPSVTFAYTRLGQTGSVADHTGTRNYVYGDSSRPWRQTSTTLPAYFGSRVWTHLYDDDSWSQLPASAQVKGRYRGFRLGSAVGGAQDLEQHYGFNSSGYLSTLTTARASGGAARTFEYGYDFEETKPPGQLSGPWVTRLGIAGNHPFTVTRTYDPDRPLLASIESKWAAESVAKFDYTHNALGQRTHAVMSGKAFEDYHHTGSPSYTAVTRHYGYNARGELQSENYYRGNVAGAPNSSDELPGRREEYRYDSIGNRRTSGPSTKEPTESQNPNNHYAANALSQYTQKFNNLVRVTGTVEAGATVQVAGATATKRDRAWGADLVPANSTSAVKGAAAVTATSAGGLVRNGTSGFFIPQEVQTFAYDDDGNVLHDSVWNYQWDAENRLIAMEHRSEVMGGFALTNADKRRLEFRYDYMGRRVRKTVYADWNGATFNATPLADTKFLYDGWNLVAELDARSPSTLPLTRSYTWGLDLVGSLTASGGVGALLQIHDHAGAGKTLLPAYDGNGNVVALVNAEPGTLNLEAIYEYTAYGEQARAQGAYANANPFRFSTKYTDSETGLVYYGHRYYNSALGRFLNRDPLGERGGVNLYAIVRNDPINKTDYLGMQDFVRLTAPAWSEKAIAPYSQGHGASRFSGDDLRGILSVMQNLSDLSEFLAEPLSEEVAPNNAVRETPLILRDMPWGLTLHETEKAIFQGIWLMLKDVANAIELKGGFGVGVDIKGKLGPLQAGAGARVTTVGGWMTLGGDYGGYQAANVGASAKMGSFQFGLKADGTAKFGTQGGQTFYRDSSDNVFIWESGQVGGQSNDWTTVGGSVNALFIEVGIEVDLGKIFQGIVNPGGDGG